MAKQIESMLDAFVALSTLDDEDVASMIKPRRNKTLREGKEFNLSKGQEELDQAKEYFDNAEGETQLEVIDVDADSMEHLKAREDYVGQIILRCNKCMANRFIDIDKLVQDESDPDRYNADDECPHCHSAGAGYEQIGQVGKVAEPEQEVVPEEEAQVENDEKSADEEVGFDNDVEAEDEIADTEEANVEEEPAEERTAADEIDFEDEEVESDGMETETSEDDDDDLDSPDLGEEFDPDDDLEEDEDKNESLHRYANLDYHYSPIVEEVEEDEYEYEPDRTAIREALSDEHTVKALVDDLFIEPDRMIIIVKAEESNSVIYEGRYSEAPRKVLDCEYTTWYQGTDSSEAWLDCKVDSNIEDGVSLNDAFRCYPREIASDRIAVWDEAENGYVFTGMFDDALEQYGDAAFICFEAPYSIVLSVVTPKWFDAEKYQAKQTEEETLFEAICRANNLSAVKVKDSRTNEYWINESLESKDDLNYIYKTFITPCQNEALTRRFKFETGYRDAIDEAMEACGKEADDYSNWRDCCDGEADDDLFVDDFNEAVEDAAELEEEPEVEDTDVTFEPQEVIEVARDAAEEVKGEELTEEEFSNIANKVDELVDEKAEELSAEEESPEEDLEEEGDDIVEEGITSFTNRKELSEAINSCKKHNRVYTVRRSLTEGFRYDLLVEANELNLVAEEPEEVTELEILDAPEESEERAIVDMNMSEKEREVLAKISRIAQDTSEAIKANYDIEADPRLIVADIIQDLRLISDVVRPEDLPDTPINNLTKEMFNDYNAMYQLVDGLMTELTGQAFETTPVQKLTQAIQALDAPMFETEAINQAIASPRFLLAAERGMVPYLSSEQVRMIESCNKKNLTEEAHDKLTYGDIYEIFCEHNRENNIKSQYADTNPLYAVGVASNANFTQEYSLAERSYKFRSDNKAFIANMGGSSIFAEALEGDDVIRLDWYLGSDGWKWDEFYLLEDGKVEEAFAEQPTRVEYVCWYDDEGSGTTDAYESEEEAKADCIANKWYSVERQECKLDADGEPLDMPECEEVFLNPDYDPDYNLEEEE